MKKKVILLVLGCFIAFSGTGFSLNGIEYLGGWVNGTVKEKGSLNGTPFMVAFNFDSRSVQKKLLLDLKGQLDFVIEPGVSVVFDPAANTEVFTNFLLKYTFPVNWRLRPYIKAGAGMIYMTYNSKEQATQFNFTPQVALGWHWFLNDAKAMALEYRRRHLSNAGIDRPNRGIDVDMVLLGVSQFF